MRQFFSLLRLDLKNTWASMFPLIMIGSAFVQAGLLRWLVPEEIEHQPIMKMVDLTEEQVFAKPMRKDPQLGLDNEEELLAWLTADASRIGLVFSGTPREPKLRVLYQGSDTAGALQMARVFGATLWSRLGGLGWAQGHRYSHLGMSRAPPPFQKMLLILVVAIDAALSGLFLLAVAIFEEKRSGALAALRVSPVGTLRYLGAKLIATAVHMIPSALILVAVVMPEAILNFELWAMLLLSCFVMSLVGVVLGVLLPSLYDSLFIIVGIVYLFLMPVFAYFLPALESAALHLLPTWGSIYGVRAALFPTGRSDDFFMAMQSMLPALILFSLLALVLVHFRLLGRSR
jgi:hypothetical protein